MKKNQQDQVYIVQFLHPGGEHRPTKTQRKNGSQPYEWNFSDHKRKFMKVKGQYIDQNNKLQNTDELYFWGEWEPWSNVHPIDTHNQSAVFPEFIHEPIFYKDSKKDPKFFNGKKNQHRQNTDPFVFADQFLYGLCQQNRKTGPTKLQYLAPGSIILFGSCKQKNYFALDTVFVISEKRKYSPKSFNNDLSYIPQNYDRIMGFDDWPLPDCTLNLVEYKGASFNTPYEAYKEKMYSFVPCKVAGDGANGFERVKLTNKDLSFISDRLNQSFKVTKSTIADNIDFWKTIREIIHQKKCYEGVRMYYPTV